MKVLIGLLIGGVLAVGAWFLLHSDTGKQSEVPKTTVTLNGESADSLPRADTATNTEETSEEAAKELPEGVYGYSVENRPLTYTQYGSGEQHVVLVGGIHGGYEWNTVLLAQEMDTYFTENPEDVPDDITLTIITAANPDGLHAVVDADDQNFFTTADIEKDTVPGRFNTNDVDLNRNFDCNWSPEAVWRSTPVSAGTEAFSEPEAAALRDLLIELDPAAVVFWHSASNGIYSSFCNGEPLRATTRLGLVYSEATRYPWYESFDFYEVNGDAADWLATQDIPAITVELSTHETVEFSKNLAGVQATLDHISKD